MQRGHEGRENPDLDQKYVGEFADEYGNEWVKRMILEEFKHEGDQNENG